LYRLTGTDIAKEEIGGTLGLSQFTSYALTLDLLEGELTDALAAGTALGPGALRCETATFPILRRFSTSAADSARAGHWRCARSPARPSIIATTPTTSS
jgi:hypothetical protein